MIQIKKYSGRRIKDGSVVTGYAAVSCESERAFILMPAKGDAGSFHIVEVEGESLEVVDGCDSIAT